MHGSVNHCAERARALRATATDGSQPACLAGRDGNRVRRALLARRTARVPVGARGQRSQGLQEGERRHGAQAERWQPQVCRRASAFRRRRPFQACDCAAAYLRRASLVRESREGEEFLSALGKSRAACPLTAMPSSTTAGTASLAECPHVRPFHSHSARARAIPQSCAADRQAREQRERRGADGNR